MTSRTELDQMLRELDPADPRPTSPTELSQLLEDVTARAENPESVTGELNAVGFGSGPPRRRRVVVGVGALLLAAVLVAVVGWVQRGPEQAGPASPSATAETVLAATNPLAVGRSVDCGGQLVPASTLALPGGVETADTPESAALRAFIADDPWAGVGSVGGGNWIRLGTSDDPLVFGQRQGRIGIGKVVNLARRGNGWTAVGLSGCSLVVPAAGERSAFVQIASLDGRTLRLTWENGRSGDGPDTPLDKVLVRVETAQDDAGLHVLVVIADNPAVRREGVQMGVGVSSVAKLTLPVGTAAPDVIIDDGAVPSQSVPVT